MIQNSRSTDNLGPGRVFAGSEIRAKYRRDSGSVTGIRDLTATWEAEFAKIWARMQDWQKKKPIRDSDRRSSECGIFVKKELSCGMRILLSRP